MSAVDELDEVPDAASPVVSFEKERRDAFQAYREKHGRDPTEEELPHCLLNSLRITLQKEEGRDLTLDEYKAACESEGIPAAVLSSYLLHRGTAESLKLARAAFFKEHGREATSEERQKFLDAAGRDDPMDHVGPVEAEEANMYGEIARLKEYISASEPTDDEIFEKACIEARAFRRAALEAVNPDVAAVRRILVSRNVAAAKRDDAPPAVVYGPPPRPEDAEAAETPFERAARLEHDKVLVVAAAAYQTMCALDKAGAKEHYEELHDKALSDEMWDQQTEVARGVIAGLGGNAECRVEAASAVDAVIETGRSNHIRRETETYATSYATLLERTAREVLEPGSDKCLPGGTYDLPSLSSDDAADIFAIIVDQGDVPRGFAVGLHRLNVLSWIYDAVMEKKEWDANVAFRKRQEAQARLKEREAQSRAAEAELLALLDDEDDAAAAPKSKKKKKKKKKRGESPVPAPVPTPVAAPETKAAAPEAPAAPPADAAAEAKPPETDVSEAAPEEAPEEAPAETAPPPEAPASEPDADPSATGERRRSLADLAAAVAAPAPAAAAPPEEDAWETVARRPRQTATAATPPRRRRSDHADAPKHAIDDLLALEATGGALADHALRKLGAFGGRCYVTQKGDIYQPITEPRRRHSSEGSEARRAGGRVFVHNVRGLTEQVIWRIFDDPRVGRVVRVQMQTDDAGAPRNYCFVDYEDATSATLAIQCLDAHVVGGRSLRVEATRADAPPASAPDASGPASLLPLLAPKDDAPAVDAPPLPPPAVAAPGLDPDVARFLDNLGLAGVGPILAREEIDWETLGLLDAEGLADAGIPRDDAQFIIVAYASLGGAPPTPAHTPAAAPRPAPPAAPVAAAPAPAAAPGTPERDECPICFEPEKSTALVPCGHILCGACAAKYEHCPVCREVVSSRMRVFW